MKEWHRDFYPQLQDAAVECVQEAGEMLYVVRIPAPSKRAHERAPDWARETNWQRACNRSRRIGTTES